MKYYKKNSTHGLHTGAVLISTGIAPHLQLARYHAIRNIQHNSNFSAWVHSFS